MRNGLCVHFPFADSEVDQRLQCLWVIPALYTLRCVRVALRLLRGLLGFRVAFWHSFISAHVYMVTAACGCPILLLDRYQVIVVQRFCRRSRSERGGCTGRMVHSEAPPNVYTAAVACGHFCHDPIFHSMILLFSAGTRFQLALFAEMEQTIGNIFYAF